MGHPMAKRDTRKSILGGVWDQDIILNKLLHFRKSPEETSKIIREKKHEKLQVLLGHYKIDTGTANGDTFRLLTILLESLVKGFKVIEPGNAPKPKHRPKEISDEHWLEVFKFVEEKKRKGLSKIVAMSHFSKQNPNGPFGKMKPASFAASYRRKQKFALDEAIRESQAAPDVFVWIGLNRKIAEIVNKTRANKTHRE